MNLYKFVLVFFFFYSIIFVAVICLLNTKLNLIKKICRVLSKWIYKPFILKYSLAFKIQDNASIRLLLALDYSWNNWCINWCFISPSSAWFTFCWLISFPTFVRTWIWWNIMVGSYWKPNWNVMVGSYWKPNWNLMVVSYWKPNWNKTLEWNLE